MNETPRNTNQFLVYIVVIHRSQSRKSVIGCSASETLYSSSLPSSSSSSSLSSSLSSSSSSFCASFHALSASFSSSKFVFLSFINVSASATESVRMKSLNTVPLLTCQTSTPMNPMGPLFHTSTASTKSGLSIMGCSHG